jgi:hypothetical protein
MRWKIIGLSMTAMFAAGLLSSASIAADERRTSPQFHFEDEYRAPVGPPGRRGESDIPSSDQVRAAAYEKSRHEKPRKSGSRGPLTVEMRPLDWHNVVGEVARLSGAKANFYNRPRLHVDQRLPSGTLVEVLEFAPDSLMSRQFDIWDRMGRLPGFSYLDNTVGDDAFRLESGTGPFPRCLHYSASEREQGLCTEDTSRYILVMPEDFAGQR